MSEKMGILGLDVASGTEAGTLKCLACQRRRENPKDTDGWLYHFHVGLCPLCRNRANIRRLRVMGEQSRADMYFTKGSKEFEAWPCQKCGAQAGKACKDDCPAVQKGRREAEGGGTFYSRHKPKGPMGPTV